MKRLGTLHRKTPVHKEDKIPDFYELSKTSPLPEITYHRGGAAAEPSTQPSFTHPAMNHVYPQAIPHFYRRQSADIMGGSYSYDFWPQLVRSRFP